MTQNDPVIQSRAELDILLANLETAVKVKSRACFFSWVQGVFQGLVAHEALVCAMPHPGASRLRFDWLGSYPIAEERFGQLCRGDGGLLHHLVTAWKRGGCVPVLLDATPSPDPPMEPVVELLQRMDLVNVAVHGLTGLDGNPVGFFAFFQLPTAPSARDARMLELIVPYLHSAWLCANCERTAPAGVHRITAREILTTREAQVLEWVKRGKSNHEIADILSISRLTVKNHVQKILRKLDVQNRAQAVARGIALNLTRNNIFDKHPQA
jgi:transcriptional regulator EpsA